MSSKRAYLTTAELEEFADITVTDEDEAYDRIGQAEELIDRYVGFQEKAVPLSYDGEVSSATATKLYDAGSGSQLIYNDDYFKGCEVEIIGGTGIGQSRTISGSSKTEKSITVSEAFTTTPDTTSVFRVYQLGKFPRAKDMRTSRDGSKYYKHIPEAVRRAAAAQVQFMIQMGDDYFAGQDADMSSESIGNYSYSQGSAGNQSSLIKLVGPRVRTLLRGIKNSGGRLVVGES